MTIEDTVASEDAAVVEQSPGSPPTSTSTSTPSDVASHPVATAAPTCTVSAPVTPDKPTRREEDEAAETQGTQQQEAALLTQKSLPAKISLPGSPVAAAGEEEPAEKQQGQAKDNEKQTEEDRVAPELPPGPTPAPHAGFLALVNSMGNTTPAQKDDAVDSDKPVDSAPETKSTPAHDKATESTAIVAHGGPPEGGAAQGTAEGAPSGDAPADTSKQQGGVHSRQGSMVVHDIPPGTPPMLTQGSSSNNSSNNLYQQSYQSHMNGNQAPQGPYHGHPGYGMPPYPGMAPMPGYYAPPYGSGPPPPGYNGYPPAGPLVAAFSNASDQMRASNLQRTDSQASDLAEQDAQRVPLTEEQLAANDSVVKTLIHTCRTWERDLAAMVGQLESLRVEVLQEEIRELTDGLEEKTDALVQMTEHRDTLQTESDARGNQVESLQDEVDKLKRANEDLARTLLAKTNIIDKLRGEYELLLNEVEVKEQTLQQVTKAANEETEEARKQRVLHNSLVELAPATFDRSFCKIFEVFYTNPMLLCTLVDKIFEVAMSDFTAMELNAEMISKLCGVLPEFDDPDTPEGNAPKLTFARFLLAKVQEEMDANFQVMDMVGTHGYDPSLSADLQTAYLRALTMVQFLGAIFKMGALPDSVIHKVIVKVLSVELPRPQEVECICRLFISIGPTLSGLPKARPLMEAYFGQIETFTRNHMLNPRLRLQLLDLIDLRANNWIMRGGGRTG